MSHEDELTPREREALEGLPRERMPSQLLEERTVQSLRQHRLLRVRRFWAPLRVGVAMAAGLLLFMAGMVYGQWRVTQPETAEKTRHQEWDESHPSDVVQRAGSAYISAMNSLAQMPDSTRNGEFARGRDAAVAIFREAAGEVVVLVPEDQLAEDVLRGLEYSNVTETSPDDDESRHIVWF